MSFDVEKVASLANLKLRKSEKESFPKQFEEILSYVDQIQKVPMTDKEAKEMGAFHVQTEFYKALQLNSLTSLRDDNKPAVEQERLLLSNDEVFENAPQSSGLPQELMFEVPSIIKR